MRCDQIVLKAHLENTKHRTCESSCLTTKWFNQQHPGFLCKTKASNDQHSVKNINELAISRKINLHSEEWLIKLLLSADEHANESNYPNATQWKGTLSLFKVQISPECREQKAKKESKSEKVSPH